MISITYTSVTGTRTRWLPTAARHMAMLRPCEAGSELAALTLSQACAIVNVPAEIERRQFCRVEIICGGQFQKEKFQAKETNFH